jgi:hypothetical protein
MILNKRSEEDSFKKQSQEPQQLKTIILVIFLLIKKVKQNKMLLEK